MGKISLVSFDVNGTLITFSRSIGLIYADAAKKFGFTVNPEVVHDAVVKQIKEMSKKHPNFGLHSGLGWKKWWKAVIISSYGTAITANSQSPKHTNDIENLCTYLIDHFAMKNEWKLTEGALDLLRYLEYKKIHMGVISNFDPRLHSILKGLGIHKYFTFVVTSYEVGYSKPDENIYREAQKAYISMGNKFEKTCSIHIGDSLKRDYYGAKNAGWNAALINPLPAEIKCDDDAAVFKNLTEFRKYYLEVN